MGWENISYGTEDPNVNGYVMMNAGFSLSDYSMSTMGGPCEPALQLSTGEQVRLVPIIPAEYTWDSSAESYSVSFYMLNYASLATTVTEYWGEGNPEGLNMSPVGITDSQTQQQVIGDGISLVFVDANTLDYDQPTVLGFGTGMSQMWLYPYTLTKISDDPSMTPLSSSVAATRFYGRLDAVKGVSSNQKFYVNSGVSASNGPVKFARMR